MRPKSRRIAAVIAVLLVGVLTVLSLDRRPRYGGATLDHWLLATLSEDYRDRTRARAALESLDARAVPELERALRARETFWTRTVESVRKRIVGAASDRPAKARIREEAARLLAKLGPDAHPAMPELILRLADEDVQVAEAAASALTAIGPEAAPVLANALAAEDFRIRFRAARLLGHPEAFERRNLTARSSLRRSLSDPAPEVRTAAATSLAVLAEGDPSVVPALVRSLDDADEKTRLAAARSLGRIGPDAIEAEGRLTELMADRESLMRLEAAVACWRITGETQRPVDVLIALLQDPDAHWQAALALGEIGPLAARAIPDLLEKVRRDVVHRPSRTPGSATLALREMGPDTIPGLVELLEHPRLSVRVSAAMALQGHGARARPAIPALIRMLEEADDEARIVAAATLGLIGPPANAALPRLLEIAAQSDDYLKATALSAVNRIGLVEASAPKPGYPAN